MGKTIYRLIALIIAVFTVAGISGCASTSAQITWYDFGAKFSSLSDMTVAENQRFALLWNKETANVTLADKKTGVSWSSVPEGASENTTQPGVFSPILLSYIESGTLNSSNTNAYSACIKKGSFSSEKIENGIQVTYYFKDIAVSVPVKYTLRKDSLQVSVDPALIGEDENMVYNISIAPFMCSVGNKANKDDNYLFVPSGSGALIYPQVIGEGITSIISEELYGYDEQITYYPATEKQKLRLPVYGAKNGDNAMCAIIEGADSSAMINTNVGSSSYAYSSVYSSFNIRGSEISSSTYMGGMSNKKVLFCKDKISEEMVVGFFPLYGEDANYSGMANTYREYLKNEKALTKKTDENMLSLKFIGGVRKKAFFMGVPYTTLAVTSDFKSVADTVTEISESYGGNIAVELKGFGKQGYDIADIAGGYGYSRKFGNINKLKVLKDSKNISVYFNFDIAHFDGSGNKIARSAIGGKNQKEYVNIWSMENAGTDKVYYLLNRGKTLSAAGKSINKTKKWNIDGIGFDTFTDSSYSDYSDKKYVAKSAYDSQMNEIAKKADEAGLKLAATGTNQYAAVCADQIFDTPTVSSGYNVYGDDVPFYQMVFKGYVPMSVSSLNLNADCNKLFLKAVEAGVGLSYTLINNYDTDILTAEQNSFYSALYADNKEQILSDISKYGDTFKKLTGLTVKRHSIISDNLRCTEYENGTKVIVNFGDNEEAYNGVNISAHDFAVIKGEAA